MTQPISMQPPRGWCFDPDDEGQPLSVPEAPEVVEPAQPEQAKPQTMAEAMWQRDEQGRFVGKVDAASPVAPAAPAAPAAPVKPAEKVEEDPTTMPEGLGQKAQERFQKLATVNRELTEKAQMLDQQVSYVRETFQQHGIKQEQFEEAANFLGAINRGDFASAEKLLLTQLQQLSLMTGKNYGGAVDALAEFPDLRQRVNGLELGEADAMEIARQRKQLAYVQQGQEQQTMQRQQAMQQEQAFAQAQSSVDAWVKQTASADIDWPLIEEQLLPDIPKLLNGIPPNKWLPIIQTQYSTLKRAATAFRRPAAPSPSALRPMGAGSPSRTPQSMHEAMWGKGA